MNLTSLVFLFIVIFLKTKILKGEDPFEAFFIRFQCYGDSQPGCTKDFIDEHPEFSLSNNGITRADTFFYLFTPENPEQPELWHKCAELIPPATKFNPKCRTEIVIPGWLCGACNMAIFREIKDEILKRSECSNVFVIDYMWGNSLDYTETHENLLILSDQIAYLVRKLKTTYQLTPEDFTCTGHSFGAQTCGLLGHKERMAVINGLDPAGGIVTEITPLDQRLDAGDADCVQVIHSNGGQCFPEFVGCNFTCGTVDIWPNGGLLQPEELCRQETLTAIAKQDYFYAFLNIIACSHLEALQFYKASISAEDAKFVAVRCQNYRQFQRGNCPNCGKNGDKCVEMGPDCCSCLKPNQRRNGGSKNFYLNTNDSCPYIDNSDINAENFQC
ncbi:pancreatic lipase-related protein 3-like [Uloborus diversus]|uniref:pancreatic lipase-related protein 3-like n=1 Tax=Uloborus diversus TaxID=327109 RepID=UPI00240A92F3|nr:pancreatic lipase-related protein 3-like [Uloborus diversus]